MKKHAIIPIFIPHRGCPNDCVFCNQRKITARTDDVTPQDAAKIIETWLTTLRPSPGISAQGQYPAVVEAAFYGGSFTGLPIGEQSAFLAVARDYKRKGLIDKIHLSTRPDYINEEILDNLRLYETDTIELGVQSLDDEVLRLSNRGHTSEDVYKESCIMSARKTAEMQPSLARLYPTIVLDDTALYEMYLRGDYIPLSRNEAVRRTAKMYRILDDAGITIMRVGLKSTDIIGEGGAVNGGTYHPAFRQLVEGEIAKERIEPLLVNADHSVTLYSNSRWYSNMIGHKACNKNYFREKYPRLNIRYSVDNRLPDGRFTVREHHYK